jgi:hypothetical protein
MDREELMRLVSAEMTRVWGEPGFSGDTVGYEWLLDNYGITEEEDARWIAILCDSMGDLLEEDLDDDELMAFLDSDEAVYRFLTGFLVKYRSSNATFQRAAG